MLPLYARLSNAEQNKVFQPHAGRRIVLATNVAETSLTVPGIRYVIDPGTARISRYSWRTKVQRLPIEPVSQASANQRKGRCGRVADGICIRLYSEEDFNTVRPLPTPRSCAPTWPPSSCRCWRSALAIWRLSRSSSRRSRAISGRSDPLERAGGGARAARHGRSRSQTAADRDRSPALAYPLDPRLAKMVISAAQTGCLSEVMVITAALSIQDPRERPMEKKQAADEQHRRFEDKDSDFLAFVNLWNYLKEQQDALGSNPFAACARRSFSPICGYASGRTFTSSCVRRSRSWASK